MVPVGVVQVGLCVMLAVGTAGLGVIAFTLITVGTEVQPDAVSRTTMLLAEPAGSPLKVVLLWKVPPLLLYCKVLPKGLDMVIVDVVVIQLGCVAVPVADTGTFKVGVMLKLFTAVQPVLVLRTVIV